MTRAARRGRSGADGAPPARPYSSPRTRRVRCRLSAPTVPCQPHPVGQPRLRRWLHMTYAAEEKPLTTLAHPIRTRAPRRRRNFAPRPASAAWRSARSRCTRIDDAFLQPNPGTLRRRPPRGRPDPDSAAPHDRLGLPAPARRLSRRARLRVRLLRAALEQRGRRLHERGRSSGDDYTGLLAIPAGFVLLGLGVGTLWKSGVDRWPPLVALPVPRALHPRARWSPRVSSSFRFPSPYVVTHVGPRRGSAGRLGAAHGTSSSRPATACDEAGTSLEKSLR